MAEIFYVYPRYKSVSFSLIGKQHIKYLSDKVKVQEIDEEALDNIQWLRRRNILLHPILYNVIGDKIRQFEVRSKRLQRLLRVKNKLGGFETADSNKISKVAVDALNQTDLVMVPSTFAQMSFKVSGVKAPIEVVPHGLNDAMLVDDGITDPQILKIKKIKDEHDAKLILFFLIHSEFRKGADIALEALRFIQMKYPNVYLVLKSQGEGGKMLEEFRKLRTIEVTSWLKDDVLRQLYDVCDVLIVPSRGGGFELNALEGVARGLPTIVPNAGCFTDYINFCIPVNVSDRPRVFTDNPIHIGTGWEVSVDDLAYTLSNVLEELDYFKEIAKTNATIARDRYNWRNICEKLYEILKKYGFCDEG